MSALDPCVPAVPAFLSRDGKTVRFYCEHCRADHIHGADGIADGKNPHRVAHCSSPASPYKRTGYVLRIAEPRPLALPGMRS